MLTDKIKWLGHASFRVDGSKTIYFDPFKIDIGKKADIIFISHKHYDHCSKDDVNKILKEDTKIVTEAESAKILGLENMI
ncbi:MAG: MBL fold metallo-hydrolase, partial [Clostridiaceae bacterium]|nr:MBL fold metallo-hydrolase [Clostridiaceae bacterium]